MAIKGSKARGIGDCVLPMAESKQGNAGGSPGASRLHVVSRNALLQLVCTLLWLSCRGGQAFICLQSPTSPGLHPALFLSLCLFFFSLASHSFPEGDRRVSNLACPRTLCASQAGEGQFQMCIFCLSHVPQGCSATPGCWIQPLHLQRLIIFQK